MSGSETNTFQTRKSVAMDLRTYEMLQKICNHRERSKIGQLKVLIEKEHEFIFGSGHSERVQAHLNKKCVWPDCDRP